MRTDEVGELLASQPQGFEMAVIEVGEDEGGYFKGCGGDLRSSLRQCFVSVNEVWQGMSNGGVSEWDL